MKNILLTLALFAGLQADTITFSNGAIVKGDVTSKNAQTATIVVNGKTTTYSMGDIKNIQMSATVSAPPPAPTPPKPVTTGPLTLEAGSTIYAKTTSSIDSRQHKRGHQFTMVLESNLMTKDNRVFAKKGSTLYGTVVDSQQAGRLVGKSAMVITLTAISTNSSRVNIQTQSINLLASKSQGRDTAGKMVRGAAIGGLINGSDGAKDGAKVGAGLAVLTRGKATGVPAGTLINFRLSAPATLK